MNCIANVTANWGIGREGRLAVSLRADLRRFQALTTGHTVVLGRKTLATFPGGRPLRNRENIILTRDPGFTVEGAAVVHSVDEVLALARGREDGDFWIIGGESVYEQLVPYCRAARLTRTFLDLPADAYFPNLDALPNWRQAEQSPVMEDGGVQFRFVDYVNESPLEY